MTDNSFLSVLSFAAVVIGGVGAILGGLSVVLHAIAPRTKTTVDDRLAADVDAAHAKLDQVLDLLRGVAPGGSTSVSPTATPAAGSAPSSATKASTVATVALLAAMIGGVSLAPACHTLGPAAADGLVAAIDCEAQHFSTQLLVDATKLADTEVQHWLAGGAAISTTAIAADLQPFDNDAKKCALAGILAGSTAALASSGSGSGAGSGSGSAVATQGLTARASVAPASSTTGDPVQVRTAVSAAARQLGWRPIKVAGGAVL